MKNMKKISLVALVLLGIFQVSFGQQESHYSQYMFNPLSYNPAYAGSRGVMSGVMVFRKQWWGFPGAPTTANLTLHTPSANERHGYGFNFTHDRLGITTQNFLELSYAFRIPTRNGHLALGLDGGFTNFTNRYSEVTTRDPDQVLPLTDLTAWLPRVGTGIFYSGERSFIGFSAPNLLAGRYWRYENNVVQDLADKQRVHYFATAGYLFPLANDVEFRPSVVYKMVADAPNQMDINATFILSQTLGFGAGYRTGDGIVLMVEYFSKRYLRLGYAFDYSLTRLQRASAGSHEFMVGFDLNWGRSRFLTPRFF